MKAFVMAALPWVLIGVALAVIFAGQAKRPKGKSEGLALGWALGLLFGVMLNNCGLWENHSLGYSLGPLWGMALATLFGSDKTDTDPPAGEDHEHDKP